VKKNIRESKFFFPKKSHQVKKQTGLTFGLPITITIAITIAIAIAIANAITLSTGITHGHPYIWGVQKPNGKTNAMPLILRFTVL